MRKLLLPLLLVILLLSLLTAAASAQALSVPGLATISSEDPEEAEASDGAEETEEGDEGEEEGCVIEDEEDVQLCAEIAKEERESEEAEECAIEDATAKLAPHPGNDTVGLAIRYQALTPVTVAIEARLRGSKGRLRLGADHAHLRRSGVYRKTFVLGERQMERALEAREFEVVLRALNAPRYCGLELNGAPRRAKRSLR